MILWCWAVKKLEPFGLFTQTPIGVCLLATALLYFLIFGRFILPNASGDNGKGATDVLINEYQGRQ